MIRRNLIQFSVCLLLIGLGFNNVSFGQLKAPKSKKATAKKAGTKNPATEKYIPGPLFETDEVLEFTLTGNLKEVFNDRSNDDPTYFPLKIEYIELNKSARSIPIRVRTRGHFRRMREHCNMPPIMININKDAKLGGTLFVKQNKLKLVTPCRDDDYVIREYLVYKIYNLLSPDCMKARLAKVTFNDETGKVKNQTKYCILLEDVDNAAQRNGNFLWDRKMTSPEGLQQDEYKKMTVFQYLIGNTDWSVPYLHNIKLSFKDSTSIPVALPYDFDHSGIVNAPYANPPEQLGLMSVRDRRYRGYCQEISQFEKTFALFNKLKDDIYKLYTNNPLLEDKYVKQTVKYLDDFYKVINNPKTAEREFTDPCTRRDKVAIGGYENQH